MASIAILGGTGYAGANLVAEAVRRGHSVTVVSRQSGAVDGATVVTGSLDDDAFLVGLAADHDVLIATVPGTALAGANARVMAAAVAGNARYGVVGGAGSMLVAEGGPRLIDAPGFHEEWKAEALAHAAVLEELRAAPEPLEWFYISPAAMFGSWAPGETTGAYRTSDDVAISGPDGGPSAISGTDYATAFVDEIETPRHRRRRFQVAH